MVSFPSDTGPPYPPPPDAGSNGIGLFALGQSQIGDIPAFEWIDTVISQYGNSPIITGLINLFFDAADPTENLSNFFDQIWNVDTAAAYGLDVWGRIVGINRNLQIPASAWFGFNESEPGTLSWNTGVSVHASPAFGFQEANSWQPFGFGTFGLNYTWSLSNQNQGGGAFYSGHGLTQNYRLDDLTYRRLILAKAAQNITDCAIPSINQILLNLFPNRGNAYVTEGSTVPPFFGFQESENALPFNQAAFYNGEALPTGMTMTYTFNFPLSAVETAIVTTSGVLPKPTGVLATVVIT